ncbi:MAG: dihydrofolate reductase [Kofleriaceae bacterium]|jgi:dihydrofolate reductase|nr:dihydrofolate reductase [Kofleriaceae bacterium]MBP6835664.1 dihydrofolate reductase [Kofleriaceae bacterium]MBP9205995.1 dihydrofolate reductase [Kofleriaceae bacterium]
MSQRIRGYLATSFDGFIAGPNHELDWLGAPPGDRSLPAGVLGFEAFMAEVGAMVMGRTTYDVVEAMAQWVYGEVPVLVATHRPLAPKVATVRAVAGPIDQLLDQALTLAGGKDVYVDGGATLRAALDAGRVDEIVVTVIPILLGRGIPLFAGLSKRRPLQIVYHRDFGGGAVQMLVRPSR